jgi:hypothetical protein
MTLSRECKQNEAWVLVFFFFSTWGLRAYRSLSAYVSIRQHTYVNIRQHTTCQHSSAYVSVRIHAHTTTWKSRAVHTYLIPTAIKAQALHSRRHTSAYVRYTSGIRQLYIPTTISIRQHPFALVTPFPWHRPGQSFNSPPVFTRSRLPALGLTTPLSPSTSLCDMKKCARFGRTTFVRDIVWTSE